MKMLLLIMLAVPQALLAQAGADSLLVGKWLVEEPAFSFWVEEPCSVKVSFGAELYDLDQYVKTHFDSMREREYWWRFQFVPEKGIVASTVVLWKIGGVKQNEALPADLIERVSIDADSIVCNEPQVTVTIPLKFN